MIIKKLVRETKRILRSKKKEVAIAWYKPEQWNLLLTVSEDRDQLEKNYSEWEEFAETKLRELDEKGIQYKKITLDIDELYQWCKIEGRLVNGESRSLFAADKLRKMKKK